MANDQSSHLGLRPFVRPGDRVKINYYRVNTAENLFRHQPVALNNSGQVQGYVVAVDNSGILGTIVGFSDTELGGLPTNLTDLSQNGFLDSSNDAFAAVADDPEQLFSLEEDTGGTLIGSANSAGQTVHMTQLATTGNTNTGVANTVLDRSTLAADTGGILTIVRPYDELVNTDGTYNDVTLNFAKWVVKFNRHQNAGFAQARLERFS